MRNKWKTLWARRPRLSRKGQIVRNLTAVVLIALFLWGLNHFPIPHDGLAFRRAEAANWVGPSDLRGTFRTTRGKWTLGTYQDWVLLQNWGGQTFEYWPRNEMGTTLCPLPDSPAFEGEAWIAAVEAPEGAVSARLDVKADCWWTPTSGGGKVLKAESGWEWEDETPARWEIAYSLEGERVGDCAFLFHVAAADRDQNGLEWRVVSTLYEWDTYTSPPSERTANCTMEAVFYDKDGGELGRASLATLEN